MRIIRKMHFPISGSLRAETCSPLPEFLVENIVKELDIDVLDGFEKVMLYDPEAYESYLKSKSLYALSDNNEDNLQAIELMKNAVGKDDNIVLIYT